MHKCSFELWPKYRTKGRGLYHIKMENKAPLNTEIQD